MPHRLKALSRILADDFCKSGTCLRILRRQRIGSFRATDYRNHSRDVGFSVCLYKLYNSHRGKEKEEALNRMRRTDVLVGMSSIILLAPSGTSGQSPAKLQFDVAMIKLAAPLTGRGTPRGGPGTANPERVNYRYVTIKNLLNDRVHDAY